MEPAVTRRKVQVQVRGTGTDSLYGLDKHLVWVYKSVVRQKLVKTFDSYGFKFLMVKAEYLTLTFFSVPRTDCKLKLQVRLSAERPSCHINLPIRARDKYIQLPQQKLFLINIISWQYVREATRQFMGFTPQDRTFSHHGPREVVTLDRMLHSPLCLPIRDRDKYNTHTKHLSDKHTLMTLCVRNGTRFDGVHC